MEEFLKIAIDPNGEKKNMINLARVAEILLPKIESENELIKGMAAGDGAKPADVEWVGKSERGEAEMNGVGGPSLSLPQSLLNP